MTAPTLGIIPIGEDNLIKYIEGLIESIKLDSCKEERHGNGCVHLDSLGRVIIHKVPCVGNAHYLMYIDKVAAARITVFNHSTKIYNFSLHGYVDENNQTYNTVNFHSHNGCIEYFKRITNETGQVIGGENSKRRITTGDVVELITYESGQPYRTIIHEKYGVGEYLCNDDDYALMYYSKDKLYVAGCRVFNRQNAIQHWTMRSNTDKHRRVGSDIIIKRANMFLQAINNHNQTE